ncbi:MAG: beta-phosphoglucomutase [Planctomycetes bacterium]|nr:beta-phosphoglucomutase [Planctomycetota bacterium]
MKYEAVIFDLDGVIVSTDEYHYQAWQKTADGEGIYFDRKINDRLRGVSRMESLEIILERAEKSYTEDEKVSMATAKNDLYRELLNNITPADILPGVEEALGKLKAMGIKVAIGSSSRNTPLILKRIGMDKSFDAIADGNDIKNSKPDPEVFLLAAKRLGIAPEKCLVVEDAHAGIDAALAGKMGAFAVGAAIDHPGAQAAAEDMTKVDIEEMVGC